MLKSIKINNVALIENLEVEFKNGLNILSGETGAGKSIIIDSFEFVLGKRADKSLIRYGCDRAEVRAEFSVANKQCDALFEVMDEYGIPREDELIISRIMTPDSNQCRVNGIKITLGMLKNLTSALADIYGQHETVELLDEKRHLQMLDSFRPNETAEYKAPVAKLFAERKAILKSLDAYGSSKNLAKNMDILEYQIKEINDANLQEGEEESLYVLRSKLNNTESFLSALNAAEFALSGFENDYNAQVGVVTALQSLNRISEMDAEASALTERLDAVKIEISDIASEISSLAESSEFDENLARETEERWDVIKNLKRKYGSTIKEILEYGAKLEEEYEFYSGSEEKVAELEADLKANEVALFEACERLTEKRKELAIKMADALISELADVGMKDVKFEAVFNDYSTDKHNEFSADGLDQVAFYISINKGQPLKPLAKTISGGEMSRFMLCLKNILAEVEGVDTMVFDEIDTGISGIAAEAVAKKMFSIAKRRQVLAVTHIAQIAAMADTHYLVCKSSDESSTFTSLIELNKNEEIGEIARLISGSSSEIALAHASEMKNKADFYKQNLE